MPIRKITKKIAHLKSRKVQIVPFTLWADKSPISKITEKNKQENNCTLQKQKDERSGKDSFKAIIMSKRNKDS